MKTRDYSYFAVASANNGVQRSQSSIKTAEGARQVMAYIQRERPYDKLIVKEVTVRTYFSDNGEWIATKRIEKRVGKEVK